MYGKKKSGSQKRRERKVAATSKKLLGATSVPGCIPESKTIPIIPESTPPQKTKLSPEAQGLFDSLYPGDMGEWAVPSDFDDSTLTLFLSKYCGISDTSALSVEEKAKKVADFLKEEMKQNDGTIRSVRFNCLFSGANFGPGGTKIKFFLIFSNWEALPPFELEYAFAQWRSGESGMDPVPLVRAPDSDQIVAFFLRKELELVRELRKNKMELIVQGRDQLAEMEEYLRYAIPHVEAGLKVLIRADSEEGFFLEVKDDRYSIVVLSDMDPECEYTDDQLEGTSPIPENYLGDTEYWATIPRDYEIIGIPSKEESETMGQCFERFYSSDGTPDHIHFLFPLDKRYHPGDIVYEFQCRIKT